LSPSHTGLRDETLKQLADVAVTGGWREGSLGELRRTDRRRSKGLASSYETMQEKLASSYETMQE
jgi:hypothetical protein